MNKKDLRPGFSDNYNLANDVYHKFNIVWNDLLEGEKISKQETPKVFLLEGQLGAGKFFTITEVKNNYRIIS